MLPERVGFTSGDLLAARGAGRRQARGAAGRGPGPAPRGHDQVRHGEGPLRSCSGADQQIQARVQVFESFSSALLSDQLRLALSLICRPSPGQVHGSFIHDELCLAPSTCSKVNFLTAIQETDEPFADCDFDGIMGLGFSDLSMGQGFNILDEIGGALPKQQVRPHSISPAPAARDYGSFRCSLRSHDVLRWPWAQTC